MGSRTTRYNLRGGVTGDAPGADSSRSFPGTHASGLDPRADPRAGLWPRLSFFVCLRPGRKFFSGDRANPLHALGASLGQVVSRRWMGPDRRQPLLRGRSCGGQPDFRTSGDAGGLCVWPGLLRKTGRIDYAVFLHFAVNTVHQLVGHLLCLSPLFFLLIWLIF